MNKRNAILFITLVLASPAMAQLYGGVHYGMNFTNGGINRFFQEYNTLYSGQLTQEFKPLKHFSGGGFQFGFGFLFGENQGGYYKTGVTVKKYGTNPSTALFSDGTGREITMFVTDFDFNIDVGVKAGPVFVMFLTGLSWRQTNLLSKSIYPDGSYSMGGEHSLNGSYYNIDRPFYPFLGIGVGYLYKWFLFTLRFEKQMGALSDGNAAVYDHMLERGFGISPTGAAEALKAYEKGMAIGFSIETNLMFFATGGKE